jgi:hypothetical protein
MPQATDVFPERLTAAQQEVTSFPRDGGGSLFIHGLAGTGKSTALMARLVALLREGRRPYEILVLVPQRAQVQAYDRAVQATDAPTRGGVDIVTYYSLCKRAVALFWPLIAREAGFACPDREPVFLTIETTQYFMWRIVEPLVVREGYFSDLTIRRGRLLSQLIDNLNKSALVGFDHTDIYRRLRSAWTGSPDHLSAFWQAQDCAIRFRAYCLEHGLLDFSLVTEAYHRYLVCHDVYQRYFRARYRHLVVDNLEENVPVAHEFVRWATQHCRSSVLALDEGGGYRVFLGADSQGATEVGERCSVSREFAELLGPTADALAFANALRRRLRSAGPDVAVGGSSARAIAGQGPAEGRFWVSMIQWVAEQITLLVERGTSPGEVAIIAPYVSEVMRFAIADRLSQRGIGLHLVRPATPLRDEPVVRALLTLVLLAHPGWRVTILGEEQPLPVEDVALALQLSIAGLDPVRARYLAQAALGPGQRALGDLSGATGSGRDQRASGRTWEVVGYQMRERYETLRVWLETYSQGAPEPVDLFLSRLFGDVLSRPGFGFHAQPEAARAYGRLVESAHKFREAVRLDDSLGEQEMSQEYVQVILGGIASAEYLEEWAEPPAGAVVLAPAYAYLTRDLRSQYQFWLDLGSEGWLNRPNQPLTHPYVLSAHWPVGQPWRDIEEEQAKRDALGRVLLGLAARCTKGIYLAYSELGIGGEEQHGGLQRAVMMVLAGAAYHG